ncbi:GntR family transcriptional regulator [Enterococcus rotai]|uniref:GntR family transcriptional regulator n=1 Tax=Enterococcus rotai TaxID=118060 RepID=UPI0032B4BD79
MKNFKIKKQTLAQATYQKLKTLIESKELSEGEKLSSELNLSKMLDVSRPILREALLRLETEGYIVRKHGVGTFVLDSKPNLRSGLEKLDSITEFVTERDYQIGTKITETLRAVQDKKVVSALALEEYQELVYFQRVRTADGVAFSIDDVYIPEKYLDEQLLEVQSKESMLEYFDHVLQHKIKKSDCLLYAENANQKTAKQLEIEENQAVQIMEQTFFNTLNQPVFYCKTTVSNTILQFYFVRNR